MTFGLNNASDMKSQFARICPWIIACLLVCSLCVKEENHIVYDFIIARNKNIFIAEHFAFGKAL